MPALSRRLLLTLAVLVSGCKAASSADLDSTVASDPAADKVTFHCPDTSRIISGPIPSSLNAYYSGQEPGGPVFWAINIKGIVPASLHLTHARVLGTAANTYLECLYQGQGTVLALDTNSKLGFAGCMMADCSADATCDHAPSACTFTCPPAALAPAPLGPPRRPLKPGRPLQPQWEKQRRVQ